MVKLTANGKHIDTLAIRNLFVKGEKNANSIFIDVDTVYEGVPLNNCAFILRGVTEDGYMIEQVLPKILDDDKIIINWIITDSFTSVKGEMKLEIRAVLNDELVLKYTMNPIEIADSPSGTNMPSLDVIDDALNSVQSSVDSIASADADITEMLAEISEMYDEFFDITTNTINGKNAYEYALDGGFEGTEAEFCTSLASIGNINTVLATIVGGDE